MNAYFFGLFSAEALAAEGIDDVFGGGLVDSIWWSFKHLLDPGAFSENYGAPVFVVLFALFNSVMGLIITGALIGFIVSAIQTAMANARVGAATVREEGHYFRGSRGIIQVMKLPFDSCGKSSDGISIICLGTPRGSPGHYSNNEMTT